MPRLQKKLPRSLHKVMRAIKLVITSRTDHGSVHATLEIDGNDTGALYLTSGELESISKVISTGALEHDIVFTTEDSFDCNQEIDDDPWDD
jgi:hypothetical protein